MTRKRPAIFRGRHFEDGIILLFVRWYLQYSLTYRDLKEIMAERNLSVDHVTIWRWVQRYMPVLNQRIHREMRHPNRSWRVDETYVKVAGSWACLGCFQPYGVPSRVAASHPHARPTLWRQRVKADQFRMGDDTLRT